MSGETIKNKPAVTNPNDMLLQRFQKITTFFFDVDGVLTDGSVLVLDNGLQARRMSIKDGFALQLALRNGYQVIIVSGAESSQVRTRLEKLGIRDIFMGILDKRALVEQLQAERQLLPAHCLFMGDDLPDLAAMRAVGLACCPADAVQEVKAAADYVSPLTGGNACAREVIEKVLKLNNHWNYEGTIASR